MGNIFKSVVVLIIGLIMSIALVWAFYGWAFGGFRANGNVILMVILFVGLLFVRETYRRIR